MSAPDASPPNPAPSYAPGNNPRYVPAPVRPKSKGALVVIVLVVALLLIIPVTYVMMSGLSPASTGDLPQAVLRGDGNWSSNATVTAYTFNVVAVNLPGAHVNPVDLQYLVSTAQYVLMFSGAAGQFNSSGGFTIRVEFSDAADIGLLSVGDRFQVMVTPVADNPLTDGRFQMNYNGVSAGTGRM